MAGIPKYLLTRPITPGWVYTVEALILALLVHGALFFLAGYQPGKRPPAARQSPGVTLLTRSGMPKEEWRKLLAWTQIHDPAQISRADGCSGYSALLEKHRSRAIGCAADEFSGILSEPELPSLPGFAALAPVPAVGPEPYRGGLFSERAGSPVPAVRTPFVTDGNGVRLELKRLFVPEDAGGEAAVRPTIVTVWGNPGMVRNHLAQSCGVAALDRAALEAIAGERFDSRRTIVIYWPEPKVEPQEEMP